MDHRPGPLRQGFEVACQAAVLHQAAEGSLDGSPLGHRLEALARSLQHFRVGPEASAMLDDTRQVDAMGAAPDPKRCRVRIDESTGGAFA